MNVLMEELFRAWCIPYEYWEVPERMEHHPDTAYGMYTFETGFKLGMQLAVSSLDPEMLAESD